MPTLNVPYTLPGLSPAENTLLQECAKTWQEHISSNQKRSAYYEAREPLRDFGLSLPERLKQEYTPLGWARKAVDMLAELVVIEGFVEPDLVDPFNLEETAGRTHLTQTVQRAITTALIHGCSFLTVGRDPSGRPLVRASTAEASAGVWDYVNERVKACLTISNMDDNHEATGLVLYLPGRTVSYTKTGGNWVEDGEETIPGNVCAAYRLAYKPMQTKPFGRSRITPDAMGLIDGANRILLSTEANEEFYAYPKYLLLGTSQDFVKESNEKALRMYMGRWMAISRDENDNAPTVTQLSAASMDPHLNMLKAWASMFASMMNIPATSLGVVADANPQSADAVEAQRNDLIVEARHACRDFGEGILDAVRMAVLMDPQQNPTQKQLDLLQIDWMNPAMPATSMTADAFSKLAGAITGFGDSEVGWEKAGLSRAEIIRLRADQQKARSQQVLDQIQIQSAANRQQAGQTGQMGAVNGGSNS